LHFPVATNRRDWWESTPDLHVRDVGTTKKVLRATLPI
jgi:hypothetical protein